jgi:uncharacterized membrane protein
MKTSNPRRPLLAPLILIVAIILFAALLVGVFKLGMMIALAGADGAIIAYQVPAVVYDWPRFTLDDVWAIFEAIWDWLLGLFDW